MEEFILEDIYEKAGLTPNKAQKEAINTLEGPVLIVAGPGTGKTQTLIFRTINLLLSRNINPKNILLCTFTKKAAIQLETRISNILNELDYDIDIGEMKINTIHGFCNNILRDNINKVPQLGRGYETLDENTQALFINNYFEKIVSEDLKIDDKYFGKWYSKWRTINKLKIYFNKFTQELIEPKELIESNDTYMAMLGKAFAVYRDILIQDNYIDFAHMQYYSLEFLKTNESGEKLQDEIKYVMVDEYQDTNYLQELFVFSVSNTDNLCVVGDEDQSLYRFRGATVRNLLEFSKHFSDTKKISLTKNYRSHMFITGFCNEFMDSIRWGKNRFNKTIDSSEENKKHFYDSVFKIEEKSKKQQVKKVGKFIDYSLKNNIINDYSEAAILLSSVRPKYSKPYINEFKKLGIPVYCPRSRMFFEFEEIKLIVGVLAKILDIKKRGNLNQDNSYSNWMEYLLGSKQLVEEKLKETPIYDFIMNKREKMNKFSDDSFDILNLFYKILGYNPFKKKLLSSTTEKYNLGKFSRLLDEFIRFYLSTKIINTKQELLNFKQYLFYSYLYYLHSEGINEYEDENKIVAKGAVPIMTIHQAKGLEFPIVIAGNLNTRARSNKNFEKKLSKFKKREPFEKIHKINSYDFMRKYYVSFTRAEDVLILTSTGTVNKRIKSSYKSLISYEDINKDEFVSVLEQENLKDENNSLKKNYAVTADIFSYNECPKKYEFYREVEFVSSYIGNRMFGLLVHQCIEDINENVLGGKDIKNIDLERLFRRTYSNLRKHMRYTLSEGVKKAAYNQVKNYIEDLGEEINNIHKAELPLKISRQGYYLQGKADLLLKDKKNNCRLIDVKTQMEKTSQNILKKYKMQLGLYKFMVEENYKKITIENSVIYWAGEQDKQRYTKYNITSEEIESFLEKCDDTIDKIEVGEFPVNPRDEKVCKRCDFNWVCNKQETQ